MTPDAPKLRINPESIEGLDRWLVAIRNVWTRETQISVMERDNLPGGAVTKQLMLRDMDWCAVAEWISIHAWSGDPAETGQDDGPVIVTGEEAK